jgi:hypothetical protein
MLRLFNGEASYFHTIWDGVYFKCIAHVSCSKWGEECFDCSLVSGKLHVRLLVTPDLFRNKHTYDEDDSVLQQIIQTCLQTFVTLQALGKSNDDIAGLIRFITCNRGILLDETFDLLLHGYAEFRSRTVLA